MIQDNYPTANVKSFKVVDTKGYGDPGASTSARARLDLEYGTGSPPLPTRVVVKISFDPTKQSSSPWYRQMHAMFENEVNFYNRIRPEVGIEAPLALGGRVDPETKRYALILEDLCTRGAHFYAMTEDVSVEDVQHLLDTHARLHARYWNSPRFKSDLSWIETHLEGNVEALMHGGFRTGLLAELNRHRFKRELLEQLRITEKELFEGMCAVKRHQATMPQTLLHGDSHIGNTYRLPDGGAGLYDWQIFVRGFASHDISYLIVTGLSIELRRKNERMLLAFYRERLLAYGVVDPPDLETMWYEHRLAMDWALCVGWLAGRSNSYGWELMVLALQRVATAFNDHETRRLVAELT